MDMRAGQQKLYDTKAKFERGDYVVPTGREDPGIVVTSGERYAIILSYDSDTDTWEEFACEVERLRRWGA